MTNLSSSTTSPLLMLGAVLGALLLLSSSPSAAAAAAADASDTAEVSASPAAAGDAAAAGPYMGVPRADLKMIRGVDFESASESASKRGFPSRNLLHLRNLRNFIDTTLGAIFERETPIGLRRAHAIVQMAWNCIAIYHPTALEFHTLLPPPGRVTDPSEHTDENRMACIAASWWQSALEMFGEEDQMLMRDYIMDEMKLFDADNSTATSLPLSDSRVAAGVRVGDQIMDYVRDDGWNSDGREGVGGVKHTRNLRPYEDTTGYLPAPHRGDGLVGADPRRWVPLPETDELGFFYVQKHVSPHIGSRGRTYLLSEEDLATRYTDVPQYNLTAEALEVVRRTATRLNDTEKMLIEIADNKFLLSNAFVDPLAFKNGWTVLEAIFYEVASNTGVVDSLVVSWRDKVRNDHVRPTSIVHSFMGNDTLTAWAGPGAGQAQMAGRDWQPYKRVMPHSEHPSGSSCICAALYDNARLVVGGDEWRTDLVFRKGSSRVEPGLTPARDITWRARTISALENMCGESRLWGGMHFSDAVPAGKRLCAGIGEMAYRRASFLVAGDEKFCKEADCSDMKPAFRNAHGSNGSSAE